MIFQRIFKLFTLRRWLKFLCVLCLLLCACQKDISSKAVATIDGEKISIAELNARLKKDWGSLSEASSMDKKDYELLKDEVLNAMINEKLMVLRARELSLKVSDEELERRIEQARNGYGEEQFKQMLADQGIDLKDWKRSLKYLMTIEKLVAAEVNAKISVKESEARAYFYKNRRDYQNEYQVHAAQIFLHNFITAKQVLKRLKKGEDFGKLAREVSLGAEAPRGGDIGLIPRGVMPEAIDEAIFSLPEGGISDVIKSPYGYHIFKIIERRSGGRRSYEEVKDRVISDLRKKKEEQAYSVWLESLRSRFTIKINKDLLSAIHQQEGDKAQAK